jgi:ABC-type Fe3+ transport system substrate-binding protein
MHTRRTVFALAAAIFAVCVNGTAGAEPSAELIEAAKKEGEVVWYTGMIVNQVVRPLTAAFQEKYGVEVKFVSTNDADTVLKIESQAKAGTMEADVFDSPGTSIPPLTEKGLIEPYLPEAAASFDPMFHGKDKMYTGIYALYLTTTYNTDLVKAEEAPKTFQDLLDPKWKGKMVWTDTRTISGPAGFIGNVLTTMGEDTGMEYLRALAKQEINRIPGNQRVVIDSVIAGEHQIGLMTYNHHAVISKGKGAPIAWVKMEPLVANLGVISLVKNAPHPNAAKLFLEYLFSDEGAKVISEAGYPPANAHVPPKDPAISPVTGNFKVTLLTPEMTKGATLAGWLKIYDELFK